MSKSLLVESVLNDWVHALPFQMQALLLTSMRGPDGCTKYNSAKSIVRYLRGVVIKPAGDWSGENDNDFMWGDYENDICKMRKGKYQFNYYAREFFKDHDSFPHHFIMHLVHCAQIVGYKHHDFKIRHHWSWFYKRACEEFHMNIESEHEMDLRLNDFGQGIHSVQSSIDGRPLVP